MCVIIQNIIISKFVGVIFLFFFFGYAIAFNGTAKKAIRDEQSSANINQHQRDVFIMMMHRDIWFVFSVVYRGAKHIIQYLMMKRSPGITAHLMLTWVWLVKDRRDFIISFNYSSDDDGGRISITCKCTRKCTRFVKVIN